MESFFVHLVSSFPPQVAIMFIAMVPITEIRASVPIGMTVFDMNASEVIFWSLLGDALPALFLIYFLRTLENFLRPRSKWLDSFFQRTFDKAAKSFHGKYEKYGMLALALLVAIPLPGTGGWTGAIAAVLFGLERFKSWLSILLGLLFSGIVVAILTKGIINIF